MREMRVCLAASAGGHLTQLLKLKHSWRQYEAVYVSTVPVVTKRLQQHGRTYIIGECNRNHPFKSILVLARCMRIAIKERPDVVISTGAMPAFLFCVAAKIIGAKIVWLDSIANTRKLSMSGQAVRYFADLFLTQWPAIAEKYKNVECVGTVV